MGINVLMFTEGSRDTTLLLNILQLLVLRQISDGDLDLIPTVSYV